MLLTVLSACGTPRPPLPPSLELPKPVTDLRASRKSNRVSLVWTVPSKTTDSTRLRHLGPTLVCRSLELAVNHCDQIGTIEPSDLPPPKPQAPNSKNKDKNATRPIEAAYSDLLSPKFAELDPTGFVTYAVETQNGDLRFAGLSNQVQIPLVPTLPPPSDLSASVTAEGVVLTWTVVLPEIEPPGVSYTYRLYRRDHSTQAIAVAGELSMNLVAAAQPSFLDNGADWQKTYDYWITIVSNLMRNSVFQVEGDDSAPIQVAVTDIFPPAMPNGLQAVASGEGQLPFIDLAWAPNTEPDLAGYNAYRRQGSADWVKLNTQPVKSPSFRDTDVVRGNLYEYSVSAIDLRGNESARSEVTRERIP